MSQQTIERVHVDVVNARLRQLEKAVAELTDENTRLKEWLRGELANTTQHWEGIAESQLQRLLSFENVLFERLESEKSHELRATIERARFCGSAADRCEAAEQRINSGHGNVIGD